MDSEATIGAVCAELGVGETELAAVRAKFAQFDTDNSGTIDVDELAVLLADMGGEYSAAEVEGYAVFLSEDAYGGKEGRQPLPCAPEAEQQGGLTGQPHVRDCCSILGPRADVDAANEALEAPEGGEEGSEEEACPTQ